MGIKPVTESGALYKNWLGASISIRISSTRSIVCLSSPNTATTDKKWLVYEQTTNSDSTFGGYPYIRVKHAINPETNVALDDYSAEKIESIVNNDINVYDVSVGTNSHQVVGKD